MRHGTVTSYQDSNNASKNLLNYFDDDLKSQL